MVKTVKLYISQTISYIVGFAVGYMINKIIAEWFSTVKRDNANVKMLMMAALQILLMIVVLDVTKTNNLGRMGYISSQIMVVGQIFEF